jgi:hypothetical protein
MTIDRECSPVPGYYCIYICVLYATRITYKTLSVSFHLLRHSSALSSNSPRAFAPLVFSPRIFASLIFSPRAPPAAAIGKGLPPMPRAELLAPFEGAFEPFKAEDPTHGGCPRVLTGV